MGAEPEPIISGRAVPLKEFGPTMSMDSARDAFRMGEPEMGRLFLKEAHGSMKEIYGSKTVGASNRPFPKGS